MAKVIAKEGAWAKEDGEGGLIFNSKRMKLVVLGKTKIASNPSEEMLISNGFVPYEEVTQYTENPDEEGFKYDRYKNKIVGYRTVLIEEDEFIEEE